MGATVMDALDASTQRKLQFCRKILTDMERVLVAFSGGLDSSVLLALAVDALGAENVVAGMVVSTQFPQRGLSAGRQLAHRLGVELVELPTPQLADTALAANPVESSYYSKSRSLSQLKELAQARGFQAVISGGDIDDITRQSGSQAEEYLSIRRPFQEAGLDHKNIYAIAAKMNLCVKCYEPSAPLPPDLVKPEPAERVRQAQAVLVKMGLDRSCLVDHGEMARIQVHREDMACAMAKAADLVHEIKQLGFHYVVLDLEAMK